MFQKSGKGAGHSSTFDVIMIPDDDDDAPLSAPSSVQKIVQYMKDTAGRLFSSGGGGSRGVSRDNSPAVPDDAVAMGDDVTPRSRAEIERLLREEGRGVWGIPKPGVPAAAGSARDLDDELEAKARGVSEMIEMEAADDEDEEDEEGETKDSFIVEDLDDEESDEDVTETTDVVRTPVVAIPSPSASPVSHSGDVGPVSPGVIVADTPDASPQGTPVSQGPAAADVVGDTPDSEKPAKPINKFLHQFLTKKGTSASPISVDNTPAKPDAETKGSEKEDKDVWEDRLNAIDKAVERIDKEREGTPQRTDVNPLDVKSLVRRPLHEGAAAVAAESSPHDMFGEFDDFLTAVSPRTATPKRNKRRSVCASDLRGADERPVSPSAKQSSPPLNVTRETLVFSPKAQDPIIAMSPVRARRVSALEMTSLGGYEDFEQGAEAGFNSTKLESGRPSVKRTQLAALQEEELTSPIIQREKKRQRATPPEERHLTTEKYTTPPEETSMDLTGNTVLHTALDVSMADDTGDAPVARTRRSNVSAQRLASDSENEATVEEQHDTAEDGTPVVQPKRKARLRVVESDSDGEDETEEPSNTGKNASPQNVVPDSDEEEKDDANKPKPDMRKAARLQSTLKSFIEDSNDDASDVADETDEMEDSVITTTLSQNSVTTIEKSLTPHKAVTPQKNAQATPLSERLNATQQRALGSAMRERGGAAGPAQTPREDARRRDAEEESQHNENAPPGEEQEADDATKNEGDDTADGDQVGSAEFGRFCWLSFWRGRGINWHRESGLTSWCGESGPTSWCGKSGLTILCGVTPQVVDMTPPVHLAW